MKRMTSCHRWRSAVGRARFRDDLDNMASGKKCARRGGVAMRAMVWARGVLVGLCVVLAARGAVAEEFARHVVVCQEGHAADVGRDVLRRGGNAFDAAVATAFALAVTHPAAGNLG